MVREIPLELYKEIHANLPIACVDAVIIHEGKILLGKRLNKPLEGTYWFPGGRVYKGECLEKALLRKISEETGLEISIIRQLETGEILTDDGPFSGPTHTINVTYYAEVVGSIIPKNDSQHDTLEWIPINDPSLHPYIKKYINSCSVV